MPIRRKTKSSRSQTKFSRSRTLRRGRGGGTKSCKRRRYSKGRKRVCRTYWKKHGGINIMFTKEYNGVEYHKIKADDLDDDLDCDDIYYYQFTNRNGVTISAGTEVDILKKIDNDKIASEKAAQNNSANSTPSTQTDLNNPEEKKLQLKQAKDSERFTTIDNAMEQFEKFKDVLKIYRKEHDNDIIYDLLYGMNTIDKYKDKVLKTNAIFLTKYSLVFNDLKERGYTIQGM